MMIAPQRAHAVYPVQELGQQLWTTIADYAIQGWQLVEEKMQTITSITNTAANVAQKINMFVLQPLAFILSGNLLKAITAGVINFVVGATNGTGVPQFVQNIQGHLQIVGDSRALAFFVQFGRNINSPFSQAISSSLRTNYLQDTSLAGFWAANRSTLPQFSTDINAYISGDWSKGGVGSWFALTTQQQNNPYLLYQSSQAQLATLVMNATQSRLSELDWGQGFLSWCGPAEEGSYTEDAAGNVTENVGTAPGDACSNTDGTPGTIKTPGTVIKAALDKALGSVQSKLEGMGQLASEVGTILGNIGTVMQTVNFATQLLGGGSSTGGLSGVAYASGSNNRSLLTQYQEAPGYLGVTSASVFQNAANSAEVSKDPETRVSQYELAWNTIKGSATAASSALTNLANFCTAAANEVQTQVERSTEDEPPPQNATTFVSAARAQAVDANGAVAAVVQPVLNQASSALATAQAARTEIARIRAKLNTGDPTVNSNYTADVLSLQNIPPTMLDVAQSQREILTSPLATASPAGSLNVSGGSLVDQMNLVSGNAAGLRSSVCTFVPIAAERRNVSSGD